MGKTSKFKVGDKVVSSRPMFGGVTHGIVDAVDGRKVGITWYTSKGKYAYCTYEGINTQFMQTVEVSK